MITKIEALEKLVIKCGVGSCAFDLDGASLVGHNPDEDDRMGAAHPGPHGTVEVVAARMTVVAGAITRSFGTQRIWTSTELGVGWVYNSQGQNHGQHR